MKRSLFYIFMALVCAACTLAGCKKDKSGPSDSTGLGTALDNAGSANCYIVSDAGKYSFSAVKGNGKKPIGNIASVEVLWETFGTDTAPQPGDLIAEVSYDEAKNAVCFATARNRRRIQQGQRPDRGEGCQRQNPLELAHLDDGHPGRPGIP